MEEEKTAKTVLAITLFLAGFFGIPAVVAWAITVLFAWNWLATFIILCVIQFLGWKIWDTFIEKLTLKETLDVIAAKPFREYALPLYCNHCTSRNIVVADNIVNGLEFTCENCKKDNQVSINFEVFAKPNELDETTLLKKLKAVNDDV